MQNETIMKYLIWNYIRKHILSLETMVLHINVKGAILHSQNGSMLVVVTQTHLMKVQVSFNFQSDSVIFNYT